MSNDTAPHDTRFQALLDQGLSREKAARILAADTGIGEPETYDDWTDEELFAGAAGLGVPDLERMTRAELITAIRNH